MRSRNAEQVGFLGRLVRWPAFLVANVALFLLIGVSTIRETYRGYTVDREISTLQAQADQLEGQKIKLLALTQTATSTDSTELQARTRLGWKKPGEQVYVLTGYRPESSVVADNYTAPTEQPLSNPELWLKYFLRPTQ